MNQRLTMVNGWLINVIIEVQRFEETQLCVVHALVVLHVVHLLRYRRMNECCFYKNIKKFYCTRSIEFLILLNSYLVLVHMYPGCLLHVHIVHIYYICRVLHVCRLYI